MLWSICTFGARLSPVIVGQRALSSWALSNKRITRIPVDTTVEKDELAKEGNESLLSTRLTNRNPRNLEQILMESKPMGFELEEGSCHYWNKIVFDKKARCLTGKVVHHSGRVLVTASSAESSLSVNLSNPTGLQAARLVGKTLAMRALEAGITDVLSPSLPTPIKKKAENAANVTSKVSVFVDALSENGLNLNEQPMIFARQYRDL